MSKFKYLAYEPGGRKRSAVISAASQDQVKQILWADGLHIVDITADFSLPRLDELFPTFIRVKRSEVILFTRQLATFVKVGMPMLDGLDVLREQASSSLMRHALTEMITDLQTGSSLSSAMAKFPRIFSDLYVDMIRSSEVSGNLDDTLRQLASYLSRDESALRKIRNAMIYPSIVLCLALGVISVLVGFVLPAFARLFSEFRATMPLPTRILLTLGIFSRDHMLSIFAVIGFSALAIFLYVRTDRGRETLDTVMFRLPMLGTIMRYAVIERYLRTLATLARAGVPITQMLDTANHALGNRLFAKRLALVRDQMLSGDGFAAPLDRTGIFPRMAIQMIKVGEETGNLDSNLEEAAEHYAEEVDYRLKRMIAFMEPALVLVVGAMVGFIAISVIAPMYSLVHEVH